jgi:hypothetical protein
LSAADIEMLARSAAAIAGSGETQPLAEVRDALLGAARRGRRRRRPGKEAT